MIIYRACWTGRTKSSLAS